MYNNINHLSVALAIKRISTATVGAVCLTLVTAGVGRAIITSGAPNHLINIAQPRMLSGVGLIKSPILGINKENICTHSLLNALNDVLTAAHCTKKYARTLRAVSGPDDKGRWRFNSVDGVTPSEMESQGCEDATPLHEPSWRCPDKTIEVEDTRTLRAVSGPDDKGRWRFNSPGSDVPNGAMESQGCEDVTFDEPSWRCPDDKIVVPVKP